MSKGQKMKIRKFKAANSHVGMRMIREALGDDASILACYEVADGVEFIATGDDLSAMVNAKGQPVDSEAARAQAMASAVTPPEQVQRRQSNLRHLGLSDDTPARDGGVTASISSVGHSANILMRNTRAAERPTKAPLRAVNTDNQQSLEKSLQAASALAIGRSVAAAKPAAAPAVATAAAPAQQSQADILALKQELGSIRHWLENHLRQSSVSSVGQLPDNLLQWSDALGFDSHWLLSKPAVHDAVNAGLSVPEALAKSLAQGVKTSALPSQGVVFIVGPAGAGKTTLVNKLVMSDIRRAGHGGLALITTDGNRLGAQEQLRAAGRVLDVPVHSAFTPDELRETLARLSQERLVIVDTAGLQARNEGSLKALAMQLACAPDADVMLALPTDADPRSLRALMSRCAGLPISAVALTRVDMSFALAPTLSLLGDYGLPVAAINQSPRMTDGIDAAKKDIDVLIAQTLVQADECMNPTPAANANTALTA